MNVPYLPHPLPEMTTFELSRALRELEQALKSLPTTAASRSEVQQQLAAVIAEQQSRLQITAGG
jgi:CheY-like chemotaxis protein